MNSSDSLRLPVLSNPGFLLSFPYIRPWSGSMRTQVLPCMFFNAFQSAYLVSVMPSTCLFLLPYCASFIFLYNTLRQPYKITILVNYFSENCRELIILAHACFCQNGPRWVQKWLWKEMNTHTKRSVGLILLANRTKPISVRCCWLCWSHVSLVSEAIFDIAVSFEGQCVCLL